MAVVLSLALAAACARPPRITVQEPIAGPDACAWFGDADDSTLYFGESEFWAAMHREGGDPAADLATSAPQVVGRFDLERERLLPPLPTGALARSGTWDVLAHPNGRVYFSSFYDPSGSIDPSTGAVEHFAAAGIGLNELALLPDGRLLATRYGESGGADGSIVVLSAEGAVEAEHRLAPVQDAAVAAKSLAFDPVRAVVWVNTDVIPRDGDPPRHDARVIELASGREIARFEEPELQFPQLDEAGRGYMAWLDGRRLLLQTSEPGELTGPRDGRTIPLDEDFPAGIDFVQDVRAQRDGRIVATRWSGVVHVVGADGTVATTRLPRPVDGGIYYTAVATGERVCATYCGGVRVVCASLPQ
jgi:hypothetical protein